MFKILSLFFLISPLSAGAETLKSRTFFSMGSALAIYADRDEKFFNEVSSDLQKFENQISTWKADSLLSRFNQSSAKWIQFDLATFGSLKTAMACAELTGNSFHPGLGKLISIWGLREKLNIPSEADRFAAFRHSDLSTLQFADHDLKIKKSSKNFWFEEGGFAKGAALDLIVENSRYHRGDKLLLNFSGQIYSHEMNEAAIADPAVRNEAAVLVNIEKESLSTSAIGVQHFIHQGKAYGHILNPDTGIPLEHTQKSVSVIHPKNIWADCLSTGLLVMSEDKKRFREWIKSHPEVKVILLERKGEELLVESSCSLKNKLKFKTDKKVSHVEENC